MQLSLRVAFLFDIRALFRLCRLHSMTGAWLLLLPCWFGLGIAPKPDGFPFWLYMILFLIGAISMRSAGCIVNDIVDRDIDPMVSRTLSRPLASGEISFRCALFTMVAMLCVGSFVLFVIGDFLVTLLSLLGAVGAVIYPFAKRFFPLPQLVLGIVFGSGSLVGYASVTGALDATAFFLYLGCIFWIVGYDTVYAYQDVVYDKKLGLYSSSILFGDHGKLYVTISYVIACFSWYYAIFLRANSFFYLEHITAVVILALLIGQVIFFDINDEKSCMAAFKSNVPIGVYLFLVIVSLSHLM